MKLSAIALGLGIMGVSSAAFATPYYVGENLTPHNNITLQFNDTPTKKQGGLDRGNIANFELKGDYRVWRDLSLGANLPFFFASKSAAARAEGTDSKAAVGNMALNINWAQTLSDSTSDFRYGYALNAEIFLPTARSDEASVVAAANPTTDLFRYATRWTSVNPTVGAFVEGDRFMLKANAGIGYSFIQKKSGLPNDRNRFNTTVQAGATWKATNWLATNLEYNTMFMDQATAGRNLNGDGLSRFKHALAPSLSGSWNETVRANLFASVPLDKRTRDIHNIQAGLGVGYIF